MLPTLVGPEGLEPSISRLKVESLTNLATNPELGLQLLFELTHHFTSVREEEFESPRSEETWSTAKRASQLPNSRSQIDGGAWIPIFGHSGVHEPFSFPRSKTLK